MKKILGLDLGTNSIGWALVETNENGKPCKIAGMGSRIIPMGAELSKFEQGQAQTKNANRRIARGTRRLNKRYKQRRNKMIYVLEQLGMLPEQVQLTEEFADPNKIDKICIKPIQKKQKQLTAFELVELRVRALTKAISLKDFGRIIYLYNQLRGYSGGNAEPEKEDNSDDEAEEKKFTKENRIVLSKVLFIGAPEEIVYKGKNITKRKVQLEIDDERFDETIIEGDTFLDILKENEVFELQVGVSISKKKTTYFIKLPNKTSWRKKMENLEKELKDQSRDLGREYYLCEYFLEILKSNRWAKIRNNVVLRARYEAEFEKIWETQCQLNPVFKRLVEDEVLLKKIVAFIFPERDHSKPETENTLKSKKEIYRKLAIENGLKYLIKKQIIFYQRDLKDQSHLISNCRFELKEKVVAKSHPVFQEYRIWEQINKLHINKRIEKGRTKKGEIKYVYVDRPIPSLLKEWIYEELQSKKEITFKSIYTKLIKDYNFQEGDEFLNGLDPKVKIKSNETKRLLQKSLKDWWNVLELDKEENTIELWNILYNVKGNEYDIESDRTKQVLSFLKKRVNSIENINELAISISKIKFSRDYSNMSLKAIEKILPLVRAGKYFNSDFSNELHNKVSRLLNESIDDPFEKSVQEYLENNIDLLTEGGLVNSYATILVFNKHTAKEYLSDELINDYNGIKRLKPGELRNPLAEQIINEALILVKDIWKQENQKPFEVRLELARELKNSAERRKKIYKSQVDNQKENERVKVKLQELEEELTQANIEKYKLWASQENLQERYIQEYKDPSKSEVEKMRLWEEQGHISPYTGKVIPLSDLFNKGKFDVDHIIPKSRYFDDSFTNKVICETAVNKEKGNRTAMEYFDSGSKIPSVRTKDIYVDEVNRMFTGVKRKNLLATKIPDDPILRQIKDTQYIVIRTKEELNKILGNEHVKTTTGGVTDYLRNHWGLTDIFKKQLRSRYESLLLNENYINEEYEKYLARKKEKKNDYEGIEKESNDIVLDKDQYAEWLISDSIKIKKNKLILKDWSKRIDHRHHAIDALVVACTEPSHIKRLNDLNKELQDWLDNHRKEYLPDFEGSPSELLEAIMDLDDEKRMEITTQLEKFSNIPSPWNGFDIDAEEAIGRIIVSQKPKDKLLIQRNIDGKLQIKIRGQLHEGTNYGKRGKGDNKKNSPETLRVELSKFAEEKFSTEKAISKIVNDQLKELIYKHFIDYKKNKKDAFSLEGIMELNRKLSDLKSKNGNSHPPISKIKIYYKSQDESFSLSKFSSKKMNRKDFDLIISRMIDRDLKINLESHVDKFKNNLRDAFSKSGIEYFNKDLEEKYNERQQDKKKFRPIKAIKLVVENEDLEQLEDNGSLQKLGRKKSFNSSLFVKTGDNYLFAVMDKDEEQGKKRVFDIITFFDATNLLKTEFIKAEDKDKVNKELIFKQYFEKKNNARLRFTLKQGDFVYMPEKDEEIILDPESPLYEGFWNSNTERSKNIHVVQKYSGKQIYFLKHNIANSIKKKIEFGSQDCYEKVGERSIKDYCIKVKIDRLGNIVNVNGIER